MKFSLGKCALLLLLCVLLTGCTGPGSTEGSPAEQAQRGEPTATPVPTVEIAGQSVPVTAETLTAVLSEGETALLEQLPALRAADFSGSPNEEEISAWAKAHPQVDVRFTVTLPDGTVLPSDTESYDCTALSPAACEAAFPKLALLPKLKSLDFGKEGGAYSWDNLARLRALLPEVPFRYAFKLYGTDCNLADKNVSLYYTPVTDDGVFLDRVLSLMPQVESVDLDSCGLEPWRCEEIRLAHPQAKVVFRVWFGDNYSVRTDVERILASMPSKGGVINPSNYYGLFYCHDVKYLDLGHNTSLTDISFVREMPKLEVAILSMCNWTDASPLADCPELEYLEMTNTLCGDLRPLSGLKKLRHLNVAGTGYDQPWGDDPIRLSDISPLYSLTELERLCVGAFNPVPPEQIAEMHRRAPQCEINVTVYEDPVGGNWRYLALADYIDTYVDTLHPRYEKLREQFGNYEPGVYSFCWNDPLYKKEAPKA